jgi:hypothetical protein
MRCSLLALLGAALLLVGCAGSLIPQASQFDSVPVYPARQVADGCSPTASLFGSGANTSSLSAVIEDPVAANPARQGCMWEKSTRVTYGPPPGPITTGSNPQQK